MYTKRFIRKCLDMVFADITSLGGMVIYGFIMLFTISLQEYALFFRLLFGFVFTVIAVIVIRLFYFKKRPEAERYENLLEKIDASAFPSLHTARIVFLSFLFIVVFKAVFPTIFFCILALLVIYSRIYLKKHDWIDIFGGFILGIIGFFLTYLF